MSWKKQIQFLYNQKGKEMFAVVSIELFKEVFEDYYDLTVIKESKNEEDRISLEEVEKCFKEKHA